MNVYPFADHGNYTMIHNSIFDILIPTLSHAESIILLVIVRKTKGWGKDEDAISYSQLATAANIKSMETIKKNTRSLAKKGLITITKTSKAQSAFVYGLNKSFFIPLPDGADDEKSNILVDSTVGALSNRGLLPHLLETQKKEEKETKRNTTAKAPNPVFEVYLLLEEVQRGINKGQTLTGSKRLLKAGFKKDDIVNCAKWLKTDPWWQGKNIPININAIEQRIDGWIKDGRPLTHKDSTASPNKPNVPEFASDGGVW